MSLAHEAPVFERIEDRPTLLEQAPHLGALVQPRMLRDPERCPLRNLPARKVEMGGCVLLLPCWRCGVLHRGRP